MKLVGLIGAMGCGKSTAAQYLVDYHGYTRVRMAGVLKDMLRTAGLSEAMIDGDLKNTPTPLLGGCTPRHAMQTLGTEWGRKLIHPDVWMFLTEPKVAALLAAGKNVVIDDIRFENEAEMVARLGGDTYRVRRREVEDVPVTHESEALWRTLPAKDEITNNFGFQNFRHNIARTLNLN